jgi:hypothetical protein
MNHLYTVYNLDGGKSWDGSMRTNPRITRNIIAEDKTIPTHISEIIHYRIKDRTSTQHEDYSYESRFINNITNSNKSPSFIKTSIADVRSRYTNYNTTWESVCTDKIEWFYVQLSMHIHITWDMINSTPTRSWSYITMYMNSNVTWKQIMSMPHLYNKPIYGTIAGNPFDRWNASSKIQHRFRQ